MVARSCKMEFITAQAIFIKMNMRDKWKSRSTRGMLILQVFNGGLQASEA